MEKMLILQQAQTLNRLEVPVCRILIFLKFFIKRECIERESIAREAFSLVMKTYICLRLRVLTRNACRHLEYVSSPGISVFTWSTCSHLAYVSSLGVNVLMWRMFPQLE